MTTRRRFIQSAGVTGLFLGAYGPLALADVGINNNFMKQLAGGFKNGTSALFVLVRKVMPDRVLAELEGSRGTVLQTSLTHEQEEKLQQALSAANAAQEG